MSKDIKKLIDEAERNQESRMDLEKTVEEQKTEITNLDKKVEEQEALINSLKKTSFNNALDVTKGSEDSEIQILREMIIEKNEKIEKKAIEIDALRIEINKLTDRFEYGGHTTHTNESEVQILKESIAEKDLVIEEKYIKIQSLQLKIDGLLNEIRKISDLLYEADNKSKSLASIVIEIKKGIGQNEAKIEELTSQINELTIELTKKPSIPETLDIGDPIIELISEKKDDAIGIKYGDIYIIDESQPDVAEGEVWEVPDDIESEVAAGEVWEPPSEPELEEIPQEIMEGEVWIAPEKAEASSKSKYEGLTIFNREPSDSETVKTRTQEILPLDLPSIDLPKKTAETTPISLDAGKINYENIQPEDLADAISEEYQGFVEGIVQEKPIAEKIEEVEERLVKPSSFLTKQNAPVVRSSHIIEEPRIMVSEENILTIDRIDGRRGCPGCGQNRTYMIHESEDKTNIILDYPRMYGKKYKCGSCGTSWREK